VKVAGIIQARMGSTRLPGKSMADLAGKPLIFRFVERVKRSLRLDEIVLATTTKSEDDVLLKVAGELDIKVFRGSENDLVDRYYQVARKFKADIVVRLCADNPVIEPAEIDRIIDYHLKTGNDFSSNTHNIDDNGYPDGLGAEVYSMGTVEKLWKVTVDPANREHPHSYIYENWDKFKVGTIKCPLEFSRPELKLDVNTSEEYEFINAIYQYCYPRNNEFHITEIIKWYDEVYMQTNI